MATAPKRRCGICAKYQPCPDHGRAARDRQRGSGAGRGYDVQWQGLRAAFLAEYPLCADCGDADRIEPATEVHHLRRVRDYPEGRLDWRNLRSLCGTHHKIRTNRGE